MLCLLLVVHNTDSILRNISVLYTHPAVTDIQCSPMFQRRQCREAGQADLTSGGLSVKMRYPHKKKEKKRYKHRERGTEWNRKM